MIKIIFKTTFATWSNDKITIRIRVTIRSSETKTLGVVIQVA